MSEKEILEEIEEIKISKGNNLFGQIIGAIPAAILTGLITWYASTVRIEEKVSRNSQDINAIAELVQEHDRQLSKGDRFTATEGARLDGRIKVLEKESESRLRVLENMTSNNQVLLDLVTDLRLDMRSLSVEMQALKKAIEEHQRDERNRE